MLTSRGASTEDLIILYECLIFLEQIFVDGWLLIRFLSQKVFVEKVSWVPELCVGHLS